MYKWLGAFVARYWLLVILGWVLLVFGVNWVAPKWDDVTHDGDLAYLPPEMTSVRAEQLLSVAFPENKARSQIVVVLERRDGPISQEDLQFASRLADRLRGMRQSQPAIVDVWDPQTEVVGKKLVSADQHAALVAVFISNEFMATANIDLLEMVQAVMAEAQEHDGVPAGLDLGVTGSAAIGGDMLMAAKESIQNTELITVFMVLAILMIVYRAPLLVLVPLTTIVVSVAVASDLVALLTQVGNIDGFQWFDFKIFKTTRIFVITILFGSGTDFCLFLISRYREELEHGLQRGQAVASALENVGDALVASALTTIFGLGMMFFASFGKFRNSGPAIGLCLVVTLVASLTLAPALLRACGRIVFWPFGVGKLSAEKAAASLGPLDRFWRSMSVQILKRPGLILVGSVLLLSPLAYAGSSVRISYDLLKELRTDRPSQVGVAMLRRHFDDGDTGPVTILARLDTRDFKNSRQDRNLIRDLSAQLYEMDHTVATVRSLTQPLGDPPGKRTSIFTPAGIELVVSKEHSRTLGAYVSQEGAYSGKVARFDVTLKPDPFSPEAAAALDRLDARLKQLSLDKSSPWYGAEFDFLGATAGTRDLKSVTESDQTLIQQLVVLAVLAVILVILRRPLICCYLIVSVLFSYLVTIGATQWMFMALYPDFDGLDWKVPIFLFVILIAVGQDYNIYLVTRVLEEQRRWGPLAGIRVAVEKTGGIITSCGIIMAASFVSMMFGSLRAMLELGFALTLGIILDTFIVRPVLVPAFLALLYRREQNSLDAESAVHSTPPQESAPRDQSEHVASW